MNPPAREIKISRNYNRAEIIADGIVHAVGAALGIAGAAVLLAIAFRSAPGAEIASVIIYVVGLLSMLGLSMAYNLWPVSPRKNPLLTAMPPITDKLLQRRECPLSAKRVIRCNAVKQRAISPSPLNYSRGTRCREQAFC
jgi:hypothetical protein